MLLVETALFCSKTTASSAFDTSLTGSATTTVSGVDTSLFSGAATIVSPMIPFPGIVIFDQLEVL
jgi:hypothetical protein